MVRKFVAPAVLVLALTLGASACSAADVKQSKFQSELVKKTKLTEKQAKCATDKMYSTFKQSEINKLYTANNAKDLPAGVEKKFETILANCITS